MRIVRFSALPLALAVCALMAGALSLPVSAAGLATGPPASLSAQIAQNNAAGAADASVNAAKMAAFEDGSLNGWEPLAARAERAGPEIICCGQFSREATTDSVQYAQDTTYYCGPAVVSEMSASVYGPSPTGLSQYTVAAYMGTTASAGTDLSQELAGLNYYVGDPDFGASEAYALVSVSWNPTTTQEDEFQEDLEWDVNVGTPVASGVYEVGMPVGGNEALYPHLVGHPYGETIQHWVAVAGYNWNTSQVYYADSATYMNQFGGGWNVPPHSWYSLANMEELLGGEGFIW
ncbi:MAG: C39 family peptidase [Candidatus Dormiibacterota bacterium]